MGERQEEALDYGRLGRWKPGEGIAIAFRDASGRARSFEDQNALVDGLIALGREHGFEVVTWGPDVGVAVGILRRGQPESLEARLRQVEEVLACMPMPPTAGRRAAHAALQARVAARMGGDR